MSIFNKFYNAKIKLYENVIGSKPQPGVTAPKAAVAPTIVPKTNTTTPAPTTTPTTAATPNAPTEAAPAEATQTQAPTLQQALDTLLATDFKNNTNNSKLLATYMAKINQTQQPQAPQ